MLIHSATYLIIIFSKPKHFPRYFLIGGFLIISSLIASSLIFDTEFLKSSFHSAGQLFIISLHRKKDLYKETPSKTVTHSLISATFFFIIASILWMLMLGYHIIFEYFPGASSWMLFNLYSVLNILISIDALLILQNSLYTHMNIGHDKIEINSVNYTSILSARDIKILELFVVDKERRLNCSTILRHLEAASETFNAAGKPEKCKQCLQKHQKATLCPDYKRIYNQINKIKRFLETMNIGTILPPENKMNITTEGWTLRMFENTRIHVSK